MKNIYINSLLVILGLCAGLQTAFAQCPPGQTEISVTMCCETFDGENGWILWDATAGTSLACVNSALNEWIDGSTVTACANAGSDVELYAYESFGDGWQGGELLVEFTEDGSANGDGAGNGCPEMGLIVNYDPPTVLPGPDGNDLTSGSGDGGVDCTVINSGNQVGALATAFTVPVDCFVPMTGCTVNANCNDVTVSLDGSGCVDASALVGAGSTGDGVLSFSLAEGQLCCDNLGANNVTLNVFSDCGGAGSCTAVVTVEDNFAPVVACPSDKEIQLRPGLCGELSTQPIPAYTDNCGATAVRTSPVADVFQSIDCAIGESGSQVYTYEITDNSNNVTVCSYAVTYIPYQNTTQTLSCNNQVNLTVNANCQPEFTADMMLEGEGYGCYECFDVAAEEIHSSTALAEWKVTVTDPATGLSCWGTVIIEDKNDPSIVCGPCTDPLVTDPDCIFNCAEEKLFSTFVYEGTTGRFGYDNNLLDGLIPSDGEDFIDDFVSDNCGDVPMVANYSDSFAKGNCGEGTLMTRTWTVNYDRVGGGTGTLNCTHYYRFDPIEVFDVDGNFTPVEAPFEEVLPNVFVPIIDETTEDVILMPKAVITIPTCNVGISPAEIAALFDSPATVDRDTDDNGIDPDEFDVDCVIESNEGIWYAYPHYYINGIRPTGPHAQPVSEVCNIIADYTDVPLDACAEGCGGNTKTLRTWVILDWCRSLHAEYQQVIHVVDDIAPRLVVNNINASVDPWKCEADILLPAPEHMEDICDADLTYTIGFVEGALTVTGSAEEGYTVHGVQEGMTRIQYVAEDCCGNRAEAFATITVSDRTAPVPVTKQNLVLELSSISGNNPNQTDDQGTGKIYTADIDNGSYDSCTEVEMEIRRARTDYCVESDTIWGDFVTFCCDDIDRLIDVELKVCDKNGNCNLIWSTVLVEDKTSGAVICPLDAVYPCTTDIWDLDLTGVPSQYSTCEQIPVVLDTAQIFEDTEPRRKRASEGGPSLGIYFGVDVPAYDPSCGFGAIRREFDNCTQWFVLEPTAGFNPSTIVWPSDMTVTCDGYDKGEPTFLEAECKLVGMNVEPEEILFEADACRKILYHWTIIDWCTYDPSQPNAGGKYEHTQVIKIVDEEDPSVTATDDICFAVNTEECTRKGMELSAIGTDVGPCSSEWISWEVHVDFNNDWTVDCTYSTNTNPLLPNGEPNPKHIAKSASGEAITIVILEELASSKGTNRVEWNVNDGCGNSGTTTTYFTVEDKKAPTPYCLNLGTAVMAPTDAFPNGMVELWAIDFNQGSFDNCSDQSNLLYTFTDVPPPPRCDEEYSSSTNQMWYDGSYWFYDSSEIVDVDAEDDDEDCPNNGYGEYDNGGFSANSGTFEGFNNEIHRWEPGLQSSGAVFTPEDVDASGYIQLPIYVWDECGSKDFCLVQLRIINNGGGALRGGVTTERAVAVPNVQALVMADYVDYPKQLMTESDGTFAFMENPMDLDYEITATKNDNYLNGVSTVDLIIMQRHILGIETLDSPYKMIAADINSDKRINGQDLVELRKLILGLYTELPQNDSWKIVAEDANLTVANAFDYNTSIQVAGMSDDMYNLNFVAAKVGDLDETAIVNGMAGTTSGRSTSLNYTDQPVAVGEEVEITMTTTEELYGFQFTLDMSNMELVSVAGQNITEANVAAVEGNMTMSYGDVKASTGDLFTLTLRAKTAGQLSELLEMNSAIANAEAYVGADLEVLNLDLRDGSEEFGLSQNEPNPFKTQTTIAYTLPQSSEVTMTMYDVTGKVLEVIRETGVKGSNIMTVDTDKLTAGVIYYKLEAGEHTATRHMIVIE